MTRIFISYSHDDIETVKEVAELLHQAKHDVCYDTELKGGDEWWKRIVGQIIERDCFIYVISKTSLESEYCQKELRKAKREKKRIIPILMEGNVQLPKHLSKLQYIDMAKLKWPRLLLSSLDQSTGTTQQFIYTDIHREADKKLLERLWPLINNWAIHRLEQQIYSGAIEYDYMMSTWWEYTDMLRPIPQSRFISDHLEKAFQKFDRVLSELLENIANIMGPKTEDEVLYIVEQSRLPNFQNSDFTIVDNLRREYRRAVIPKYNALLKQHHELVATIKQILPDFF